MTSPVEQLMRDLVRICELRKLDYALVGGLAVRAYGVPRPTYDVDITVALDRDQIPAFIAEIEAIGYDVDDIYKRGWTDEVAGMPLIKATTFVDGRALPGDIFLAENDFQRSLMSRKVLAAVEGIKAWVVSAEDLVLMKLVADRLRDRADVHDIFFMQGRLDEPYLFEWGQRLGVRDKLVAALYEAGFASE